MVVLEKLRCMTIKEPQLQYLESHKRNIYNMQNACIESEKEY